MIGVDVAGDERIAGQPQRGIHPDAAFGVEADVSDGRQGHQATSLGIHSGVRPR
jgi:hypothetical protein